MYISRVTLRMAEIDANVLGKIAGGGGYRIHQALWRLFDEEPEANRDFLYRQESETALSRFMVVSRRLPVDRDGLWDVESKEYRPRLSAGQRLVFSVRVNPVISRRDEAGRQHRHDVVMDMKRRRKRQEEMMSQAELVQQAVWPWMEERAAKSGFAAKLRDFQVDGYRQHQLSGKGGRRIRFSTIDCLGLFTVTDPKLLMETLYHGLGSAKAFGCGLLLVRRP